MIRLKYGNTNTFYIPGKEGGLLIDTDYAGTLPLFFHAVKAAGIAVSDIRYLLATHYHPDHIGLAGELQQLGVKLVIADVQLDQVHYADKIFARDKRLRYVPPDEKTAAVIRIDESRDFLRKLGISGEIIHTPSHSPDSITLILDDGDCFPGDLEPLAYLAAYDGTNPALQRDWDAVLKHHPKRILYAHANEQIL